MQKWYIEHAAAIKVRHTTDHMLLWGHNCYPDMSLEGLSLSGDPPVGGKRKESVKTMCHLFTFLCALQYNRAGQLKSILLGMEVVIVLCHRSRIHLVSCL